MGDENNTNSGGTPEDKTLRGLSLSSRLPSKLFLSLSLSLVIATCFLLFPLLGTNHESLSPGPLSPAHHLLGADCKSCHDSPFQRVSDASCNSCHKMEHHPLRKEGMNDGVHQLDGRCVDCHTEHHGREGLLPKESRLCTDCHARMQGGDSKSDLLDVKSWSAHPEFHISMEGPRRVRITDPLAQDRAQIRLNHKVHLRKGLQGPDGRENLTCQSCHRLSPDLKGIIPIRFETDCQRCHSLEFDERLPGKEVPHGEPRAVVEFLYGEYAKAALEGRLPGATADRALPGSEPRRVEGITFTKAEIEPATRHAEALVFDKTGCALCHTVTRKETVSSNSESVYAVAKTEIPHQWFTKASFSHSAHLNVSCASCHHDSHNSERTEDILIPARTTCTECHYDSKRGQGVSSACVECHNYHDGTFIEEEKQRTLKEILHQ